MNKLLHKQEYLPKKLIAELQKAYNGSGDYRTRNNFLRCLGIIYSKQLSESIGINDYLALGASYWKKIFSGDYHKKVLIPLLELDIIQSSDYGYRNTNSCGLVGIRYRINPLLLTGECEVVRYDDKSTVISAEEILVNSSQEFLGITVVDRNFNISILADKAQEFVENEVVDICKSQIKPEFVQYFPSTYVITYDEYTNGSVTTKYGSVGSVTAHAQMHGMELFAYNQAFYLANSEEFLRSKIETTRIHYLYEISKVGRIPIEYKRSKTNLRLHNYLTNFPNRLLHFLKLNNQGLVQFDLQTSQFLLFANILNIYLWHGEEHLLGLFKQRLNQQYLKRLVKVLKTFHMQLPSCGVDISNHRSCVNSGSDVLEFIRDVFFSDFYEVIRSTLNLPDRSVAKQLMFKLLFKPTTKSDAFIEKLKTRYPVVIAIIDSFKTSDNPQGKSSNKGKKSQNNVEKKDMQSNFSVFLQCIEAEIYVDNILLPMREQLVPCFTRHDSVVVAWSYQDQVEGHIKSVFAGLEFRYNQKYLDMTLAAYSPEELEENGITDYWADKLYIEDVTYEGQPVYNHSISEDDVDNDLDVDEIDPDLLERLEELGIQADYSDVVDQEFLIDLLQLPLTEEQGTTLEIELENLRQGMSCFQPETNKLIKELVEKHSYS